MRAVLTETDPIPFLGNRAGVALEALRANYTHLDPDRPVIWEKGKEDRKSLVIETWAGEKVNATLATALSAWLGAEYSCNDRTFRLDCDEGRWRELLSQKTVDRDFLEAGLEQTLTTSQEECAVKFGQLLPPFLRREVEREDTYDLKGALEIASELPEALFLESSPKAG
jgi:hypothetical protein